MIAFKMLEIGPNMQPRLSLWKEAEVFEIDAENHSVSLRTPEASAVHKQHLLRFEQGTDSITSERQHLLHVRKVPPEMLRPPTQAPQQQHS